MVLLLELNHLVQSIRIDGYIYFYWNISYLILKTSTNMNFFRSKATLWVTLFLHVFVLSSFHFYLNIYNINKVNPLLFKNCYSFVLCIQTSGYTLLGLRSTSRKLYKSTLHFRHYPKKVMILPCTNRSFVLKSDHIGPPVTYTQRDKLPVTFI